MNVQTLPKANSNGIRQVVLASSSFPLDEGLELANRCLSYTVVYIFLFLTGIIFQN